MASSAAEADSEVKVRRMRREEGGIVHYCHEASLRYYP